MSKMYAVSMQLVLVPLCKVIFQIVLSPGSLCSVCVCLVWCCCVYCSNLMVSAVSWSFSSLTGKDALFEARSRGWSFRLKLKPPSWMLILTCLSPRRREHRIRFRDSSRYVCTLIIGENSLLIINYKLIKIQRHLKQTKYWTDRYVNKRLVD